MKTIKLEIEIDLSNGYHRNSSAEFDANRVAETLQGAIKLVSSIYPDDLVGNEYALRTPQGFPVGKFKVTKTHEEMQFV